MKRNKNKKNGSNLANRGTLDKKHMEKMDMFEKINNSLPIKKKKLLKLRLRLDELCQMSPNKYTHEDVHQKSILMDAIRKLQEEIVSIENYKEPLDYIVKTLPILVNYYDNKEIFNDRFYEEIINEESDSNKRNILSYFMKENEKQNKSSVAIEKKKAEEGVSASASPSKNHDEEDYSSYSKSKLYDSYLNVTNGCKNKSAKQKNNICLAPDCGGEKIICHNDGHLVCQKCGMSETILLTTDKPSFKEPIQDSGTYAYKRINHLTEILSQLQAKESTDIPVRVFEDIHRELKIRKINKNELDIFKLRKILKKLEYRKYYEHVPHILQIINGMEPPNFSRKDEAKIKRMFKDIQKPFTLYCPSDRKNFLNYSYVLHKFCELLDLDEYVNYFPLLKNNSKLLQHDKIWKQICKYMKWEFYKSI